MDTIENPDFCEALLDQTMKFWMDFETGFMKAVGDIVDVVMTGDNLAGQHGPLFSTDFYKSILKPRQKKVVRHIKSLTDAKIWYHTCGACVSQHVFPFATPEEVKADAKKYIEIFKPGGGYVFNNVHNIQGGVPAENIVALMDAGYKYGFYNK